MSRPMSAEDPIHNLSLKKESWPPDPARFIAVHELAAYPLNIDLFGPGVYFLTKWHSVSNPGKLLTNDPRGTAFEVDPEKLVAPALFVDGHSQPCDFTAGIKKNPLRALEPTKIGSGTNPSTNL